MFKGGETEIEENQNRQEQQPDHRGLLGRIEIVSRNLRLLAKGGKLDAEPIKGFRSFIAGLRDQHFIPAATEAYIAPEVETETQRNWRLNSVTDVQPLAYASIEYLKAVREGLEQAGENISNFVVPTAEYGLFDPRRAAQFSRKDRERHKTALVITGGAFQPMAMGMDWIKDRLENGIDTRHEPIIIDRKIFAPFIDQLKLDEIGTRYNIHVSSSPEETAKLLAAHTKEKARRPKVPQARYKMEMGGATLIDSGNKSKRAKLGVVYNGEHGKTFFAGDFIARRNALEKGGNGGANCAAKAEFFIIRNFMNGARRNTLKNNLEAAGIEKDKLGLTTEDTTIHFHDLSPDDPEFQDYKDSKVLMPGQPEFPGAEMSEAAQVDGLAGILFRAHKAYERKGIPLEQRKITVQSVQSWAPLGKLLNKNPEEIDPNTIPVITTMGTADFVLVSDLVSRLKNNKEADFEDVFAHPEDPSRPIGNTDDYLVTLSPMAKAAAALRHVSGIHISNEELIAATKRKVLPETFTIVTNEDLVFEGEGRERSLDPGLEMPEGCERAEIDYPAISRLQQVGLWAESGNAFVLIPPDPKTASVDEKLKFLLALTTVYEGKSLGEKEIKGKAAVILDEHGWAEPYLDILYHQGKLGLNGEKLSDIISIVHSKDKILEGLQRSYDPHEIYPFELNKVDREAHPYASKYDRSNHRNNFYNMDLPEHEEDQTRRGFAIFNSAKALKESFLESTGRIVTGLLKSGFDFVSTGGGGKGLMGEVYQAAYRMQDEGHHVPIRGCQTEASKPEGYPEGANKRGLKVDNVPSMFHRIEAIIDRGQMFLLDGGGKGSLREQVFAWVDSFILESGKSTIIFDNSTDHMGRPAKTYEPLTELMGPHMEELKIHVGRSVDEVVRMGADQARKLTPSV